MVVAYAFNSSTWEAEVGGSLSSKPTWSAKFPDSQDYTMKPCLKTNKQIKAKREKKERKGQVWSKYTYAVFLKEI